MSKSSSTSIVPLITALLILGWTGWVGTSHYFKLSTTQSQLGQADSVLMELEKERNALTQLYQSSKKESVSLATVQEEKVAKVFPVKEDLTALTRIFDDFAFQTHYPNNPFFISQLTYGTAQPGGDDAYMVLPITMVVEASERNFEKFLEFVETSGSLEQGTRLLSVNGITMQTADRDTGILRLQLSLNAYLQR